MSVIGKLSPLLVLLAFFITGCSNVEMRPLPQGISKIYMVDNPAVIVPDFEMVLYNEFGQRGISLVPIQEKDVKSLPSKSYYMRYTARQSWDFKTYMSKARIDIYQGARPLAYLNYYYNYFDKISLLKWEHPSDKLEEPFKEFFINYDK